MRVEIDSPLSSIWAFSIDLKRIQTQRSLFRDLGGDKTFTLVRQQSSSLSPSLNPCLSSGGNRSRRLEDTQRSLTVKSMAELLGVHSGTDGKGKHKHRMFPSQLQSLQAAPAL